MTQIKRLYASSGPEVIIETLQITIGSDVHYLCQGYEGNRGVVMALNPTGSNTNPITYLWTIRNSAGRAESGTYYLSGKYQDTGGDTVTAPAAAGYVSFLSSACFVEPAAGRGKNYSKGVLASTSAVTASGKIPDMTGVDVHIYIGTRYTAGYTATAADTDGMVGRIRCFGYATEEQAKLISQRS